MNVIVTGAAGFVGSHLVDRLVDEGSHVIAIDNLLTGKLENLSRAIAGGRCTFLFADVSDAVGLRRSLMDTTDGANEIYHLASPASPEAYGAFPWETLRVNSAGTMTLLELAAEYKARLLYSSTSEVYGDPLEHPQRETYFGNVNPIGPRACYDEGKRFGEAAVSVARAKFGIDARLVRIFNCYGPRMDVADGRLIPEIFSAAAARRPFPIHGDGLQTRSLTFVDDLVDGLMKSMRTPMAYFTPVNLGAEDERTVVDIVKLVAEIANVPYVVDAREARPEDPRRRRPIVDVARSIGWVPKTPLESGLRETYQWYLQRASQVAV